MVVPSLLWIGPDGNLSNTENISVGPAQTFGLVTKRSLTLEYLESSQAGKYSCKGIVSIPRIELTLQVCAYKEIVVTGMYICCVYAYL